MDTFLKFLALVLVFVVILVIIQKPGPLFDNKREIQAEQQP